MTQVKYQELSDEIKREVYEYYTAEKKKNVKLEFEDAMLVWFEDNFEGWLMKRFQLTPGGGRRRTVRMEADGEPGSEKREADERRGKARRKHTRLDIEIPARMVDVLESPSADAHATIHTIENIGRGGFFFRSSKSIDVSSVIRVVIKFSEVDASLNDIEADAVVVRVEDAGAGEYGISVRFNDIDEIEHRRDLDLFIFKNIVQRQGELSLSD